MTTVIDEASSETPEPLTLPTVTSNGRWERLPSTERVRASVHVVLPRPASRLPCGGDRLGKLLWEPYLACLSLPQPSLSLRQPNLPQPVPAFSSLPQPTSAFLAFLSLSSLSQPTSAFPSLTQSSLTFHGLSHPPSAFPSLSQPNTGSLTFTSLSQPSPACLSLLQPSPTYHSLP
ncbi:hypothetical protein O3P69_002397 [Scylla paramamosain]|uniref:Uncharacterized protein n=1 Tax=Scylla paramamosain TaxID=85552 RepID=A0AAW0V8H6_SCYPA